MGHIVANLDKSFKIELTIKSLIETAIRFVLPIKNDQYQNLSDEERRIFDNMYPHLVERERMTNLVAQASDYLTFGATSTFTAHLILAGMGMMLLSGVMTGFALGLMAFGIALIAASVIYREYAVNRQRENILTEGGIKIAFNAVKELTEGREETLDNLNEIESYFNGLKTKFSSDKDLCHIIDEVKHWISDARDLLSDEAVNIVKEGILQHRDMTEAPVSANVELKDVLTDLYEEKIQGKIKDIARAPITEIDAFRKGWQKLTKLPPRPEIISAIDYDMLYRDYVDTRSTIESSVRGLKLVADAMNSDDAGLEKRVRKAASRVASELQSQQKTFAQKILSNQKSLKAVPGLNSAQMRSVSKNLVSGQREYNPVAIIESGFADLQKVQAPKKKSLVRSFHKGVAKRARQIMNFKGPKPK